MEKLNDERAKIAAEEAKKARLVLQTDLHQKATEIADLQEVLKQREAKLADAQKAQAELLRKQRELNDAKREVELTVEKRVQAGLATTREQAKKEAEESLKLKVLEKVIRKYDNLPASNHLLKPEVQQTIVEEVTAYVTLSQQALPGITAAPRIAEIVAKTTGLVAQQTIDIPLMK